MKVEPQPETTERHAECGKAFAALANMGLEDFRYRIIRYRGRIEAGDFNAEGEFQLHVDPSGRPLFVQFDEHPDDLADGTVLRLTLGNGRVLHCQVLGDSPLCSIVQGP